MKAPLVNAKNNRSMNDLPDVSEGIVDLMQPLVFTVIAKDTIEGVVQEREFKQRTMAMIAPLTAQQLKILPEGQRAWRWQSIYALPGLELKPDDRIIYKGINYRVMSKEDWQAYGYIHYQVCEDFDGLSEALDD